MPVLSVGEKRILYIHVPKTGGTFVEELMRSYGSVTGIRWASGRDGFSGLPCSPQHFHRPLVEHMHSTDPRDVQHSFDFVFMTVRHPLERLMSEFRFRAPRGRRSRWKRLGVPSSFSRWLITTLNSYKRDPYIFDNHIRPQHEFHAFDAKVFKLEDGLQGVEQALNRTTGMAGSSPRAPVNRSHASSALRFGVSDKAHKLLQDVYAQDYEMFGY